MTKEKVGIEIAARYALQPNMLGFCGDDQCQKVLRQFLAGVEGEETAREILENHGFPHLNSFVEAIGKLRGKDSYDPEVVRSYWLGGDLAMKSAEGRKYLVEAYEKNMGKPFADALNRVLPREIYLTHFSQVALVAATDYGFNERLAVINKCMVGAGIVQKFGDGKVVVERDWLMKNDERFQMGTKRIVEILDPDLVTTLEMGDFVAVHLGFVTQKISQYEMESIRYWNSLVVESGLIS